MELDRTHPTKTMKLHHQTSADIQQNKIHQSYFEFSFYLVTNMDQIIYAFIPVNRENTLYYCNVMILLIAVEILQHLKNEISLKH